MKIINFIKEKKLIKLRTLITLIVLLMFNSYAWFLYNTKVKGALTAHVAGWNLEFRAGDKDLESRVLFEVDRIYPGKTYSETITANNKGEMEAKLTYKIKSVTILGETIEINDDIEEVLEKDYPFTIKIELVNENLAAGTGKGQFVISLEWLYDSGNDEQDTEWGERAYEFYSINPGEVSIYMEIDITATQKPQP